MKKTIFGIEIEEVEYKEENLIKVNLTDTDGSVEGIWACLDDETKKEYDKNINSEKVYLATTANASLMGVPWGCYIPILFRGSNRPVSYKKTLLELSEGPIYNDRFFEKEKE